MTHDDDIKHAHASPYDPVGGNSDAPAEGSTVRSGAPKAADVPTADEDAVAAAIREVYDPEIPVNIYDLGLIYNIAIQESGDVAVTMTLTAPACPVAGSLPKEVADKIATVPGVGEVSVALAWDPPWTPANMSEVAKVALDMF